MGRSLLILGAPGSGKSTMLYDLARGLIERARQNGDEPIPMVFNLSSWTEKLTLADWLAQELNNIYYVPRKTAPDWIRGNKLLLLLDGLDEVRQESRAKCVDAINQFRKEHGLTSLAVCSRSQDYEELGAKLSFDGAIEVQPLTQKQVTEFFYRFGKEMAGLKSVLKKDSALREMAETPLFLSIMVMSYRERQDIDILLSQDLDTQRKYLFENYIARMLEGSRSNNILFEKRDITLWLSWLALKMITHNQIPFSLEDMQPTWLPAKKQWMIKKSNIILIASLSIMLSSAIIGGFIGLLGGELSGGMTAGLSLGAFCALVVILFGFGREGWNDVQMIGIVLWDWKNAKKVLADKLTFGFIVGLIFGLIWKPSYGVFLGLIFGLIGLPRATPVNHISHPEQRVFLSLRNSWLSFVVFGPVFGLFFALTLGQYSEQISLWLRTGNVNFVADILKEALTSVATFGLIFGLNFGLKYGGYSVIKHYALRLILNWNNFIPWKFVPFLDYCTDLIFLQRVGSGYIFVHRLLMEHFAEKHKETE
jgi:hypothetical protein